MHKRFINIALIFSLLISVIGVNATKVYCVALKTTLEKNCCGNKDKGNGCCKDVKVIVKLNTDLSLVDASVSLADVQLFPVSFFNNFINFPAVTEKLRSYSIYSPPSIIEDIPVLIQVFRI